MKALLNFCGFTKIVELKTNVAPKTLLYSLIQEKKSSKPVEMINNKPTKISEKNHNIFMNNMVFEFVEYERHSVPDMNGFSKEEIAIYNCKTK